MKQKNTIEKMNKSQYSSLKCKNMYIKFYLDFKREGEYEILIPV